MFLWWKQNEDANATNLPVSSSAFYGKIHTKHLAQLAYNSLGNTAIIIITVVSSNHDLKEIIEAGGVEKKDSYEVSHSSLQIPSLSFRGCAKLLNTSELYCS